MPYSQLTFTQGSTCFLCADPNCNTCSNSSFGACTTCNAPYNIASGNCTGCPTGCANCAANGTCSQCANFYFQQPNNSCSACPNSPACLTCSSTNSTACTSCNTGYFLVTINETCQPCPGYCSACTSANLCTALLNPTGYVLLPVSTTANVIAACDPGCNTCSTSNPQICINCNNGYFLGTNFVCTPCTAGSNCAACSSTSPGVCLTCYPGSFLNANNACVQCTFPCTSCTAGSATSCTACVIGYVLSSNTCAAISTLSSNSSTILQNCANAYNSTNGLVCNLCVVGYTNTGAGCAPCIQGCLVCNAALLTTCSSCAPGYFLNSSSVCQACTASCSQCSNNKCLVCVSGYSLNQNFTCQANCMNPCATCSTTNPLSCLSCIAGYNFTNGSCVANTSCNASANCIACPFGYTLLNAMTQGSANQTCFACNNASNCARCSSANASQCISCSMGFFLNNGACTSCPSGCSNCLSSVFCTSCSSGFIPQQSGSLTGNGANGPLNCSAACTSPCVSCMGTPTTCTSCNTTGFTLQGSVCLSNFNF